MTLALPGIVLYIKNESTIPIVVAITIVQIITSTVDTANIPMPKIVFTWTTIIKGIDMTIEAIGGPGINGIDTQENIHTYTNMEDITAKIHI